MTGNLKGLWSYRIAGDYQVITDVQPDRLVIFAVEAGPSETCTTGDLRASQLLASRETSFAIEPIVERR